jgi:transposase
MDNKAQSKQLEKRRLQAGRLLLKGWSQSEVARRVGVARSTVCGWAAQLEAGGLEALRSRGLRGRPASLDAADQRQLKRVLLQGAVASGFATEVWTLGRVRAVLREQFDVTLSESQVSRVLGAIGFSCQRPTGRALQRDTQAIRRWKTQRWPALKKTPQNKGV